MGLPLVFRAEGARVATFAGGVVVETLTVLTRA